MGAGVSADQSIGEDHPAQNVVVDTRFDHFAEWSFDKVMPIVGIHALLHLFTRDKRFEQ